MELVHGGRWAVSRNDGGMQAVASREERARVNEERGGLGAWVADRMAARRERDLDRQGAVGPVPVETFATAKADASVASTQRPSGLADGFAGWVRGILDRRQETRAKRHLRVVETLALGGRRQLMLVSCGGERFLVGSGGDRVETIIRVLGEETEL